MRAIIEIRTKGPGLYEFTGQVRSFLDGFGRTEGLLNLFVRHTSCSLLIQENADPDVRTDLQEFFRRLAPPADHPAMQWITHRQEGPDDMPAHIRASVLPVSLSIPVADGEMLLGTWQGIYLFEHRTNSHLRQIVLTLSLLGAGQK